MLYRVLLVVACVFFAGNTDYLGANDLETELDLHHEFVGAKLPESSNPEEVALQSRFQMVASVATSSRFQQRIRSLTELGLLSLDTRDQVSQTAVHVAERFNESNPVNSNIERSLTGYLAVEGYLSLTQLIHESQTYGFNEQFVSIQEKSLAALRLWEAGKDISRLMTEIDEEYRPVYLKFVETKSAEQNNLRKLQLQSALKFNALLPGMDAATVREVLNQKNPNFLDLFPEKLRANKPLTQLFLDLQFSTVVASASKFCPSCSTEDLQALKNLSDSSKSASDQIASVFSRLQEDIEVNVENFPQAMAESTSHQISQIIDLIRLHRAAYEKHTSWAESFRFLEHRRSLSALDMLEASCRSLYTKLRSAGTIEELSRRVRTASWLKLISVYTLESLHNHSSLTVDYSALAGRIVQGNDVSKYDKDMIQTLLRLERKQGTLDAYINRNTVTTAALATLLAAEAVSIVASGGASAAAMPATASALKLAMIAGGRTAVILAKVTLATDAALRIADRADQQGWAGVASFDTAFDVMTIMTVAPRIPLPTGVANTQLQKITKVVQTKLATFQYGSLRQLAVASAAYSVYQFAYAEAISAELSKDGYIIDPTSLRRRAAVNIALSSLALLGNSRYREQQSRSNPEGFAAVEKSLSWSENVLVRRLKGAINPIRAGRNFYQARPSAWRAAVGTGIGVAYAAYDYLLINEAILMSYTNPDFNYIEKIQEREPYPTLNSGESALTLVGLDPLDAFLYVGSHAKGSHRSELAKYGNSYEIDDFSSPQDFLKQLKKYAKKNGPIRFLKIMTHGRPGQLYTREANTDAIIGDANSGWIDAAWLNSYRDEIRSVAREVFAPNARVVLWACLVGSNLDSPIVNGQPLDVGDQFLEAFGQSLLIKGGTVDSSTRMLVGLDALFGNSLRSAARAGIEFDAERARPLVPVFDLEGGAPVASDKVNYLGQGHLYGIGVLSDDINVKESASYMLERVAKIVIRMPQVWYKYGIQLEGSWWHNRYKFRTFEPIEN